MSECPEIWNWISEHVKAEATVTKFQKLVNNWFVTSKFGREQLELTIIITWTLWAISQLAYSNKKS